MCITTVYLIYSMVINLSFLIYLSISISITVLYSFWMILFFCCRKLHVFPFASNLGLTQHVPCCSSHISQQVGNLTRLQRLATNTDICSNQSATNAFMCHKYWHGLKPCCNKYICVLKPNWNKYWHVPQILTCAKTWVPQISTCAHVKVPKTLTSAQIHSFLLLKGCPIHPICLSSTLQTTSNQISKGNAKKQRETGWKKFAAYFGNCFI